MVIVGHLFQLRNIQKLRKVVEVEHRLVVAMFAEERHVFTEIHVLEVICDKATVATLDAFTEFGDGIGMVFHYSLLRV